VDVIANAKGLAPTVAKRAREIEEARRLPADLAKDFSGAGLFRMCVPKSLGGLESDAMTLVRAIEIVSEADASAGWCVMIGATTGVTSAYLQRDVAKEIYGAADVITGGVFAPMGRAVPERDGYRLNGRWQWASGSANCHWLMGGAVILENGKPRLLPNEMPDSRMLIFPANAAALPDTWHVSGLCGTGSGEMEVKDLFVAHARSVSIIVDKPVEKGPLYVFPVFGLLAIGIAAVMLGNASGAIEALVGLAGGKQPQGSRKTLAERATAQVTLAQSAAALRSARAFFYDAIERAWEKAKGTGDIPLETRADLRLASTHAARTSSDVARAMYDLGGGSSVYLTSQLQRRFRDAHAGTQHIMVSPATYELTGRVLMGLPTDATQL
jgi:alkylation response protein AidB-like acyl-CoA dehydrogenase